MRPEDLSISIPRPNNSAKFIVIEGQGFTGKTIQAQLLASWLIGYRENNWQIPIVKVTQEPGGAPSAEPIRKQILERRAAGILTPEQELNLFYASRFHFLNEVVIPAICREEWVLSTRFSASTFVYQGDEGGVDKSLIWEYEDAVVGQWQPDLYLLLDVSEKEIWNRLNDPALARQRHGFNELDKSKIRSRRKSYLDLATENRMRNWQIIDGTGTTDEVFMRIKDAVYFKLLAPAVLGLV